MARYGVAPTKTNLLRLKTELVFVDEGHELLDQKKDILTGELLALLDRARAAEAEADKMLAAAFKSLQSALIRMGRAPVTSVSHAMGLKTGVSVSTRRVMGVSLPRVEISVPQLSPSYALGETSFWADEVAGRFRDAAKSLGALAETKVSLSLLARELKKTVRRVNALEKIAIPDLQETVKYITDSLDEMERETFFTMKLIKNRLAQRRTRRANK
jgi:V/A-type H+-transporting ATPase subunit D